ncbi:glutamic acid-rich protein-like [Cynara cardunculus var. scolymus]|uniref:glutamic acid-rich protein-like n=1 Tax=Cynara cardunculus var. scolymus TaxID=59895 RepID=UPI000D62DB86|nr:glutamic acid-rich protein-like [Cynara cardunculus var. scolymus]
MTHKQSYVLGDADFDPISSSRSEKQLKRKQNSESGKKSSRHRKKQKSRPDSESGKTRNRQHKKRYKKKKEHQLDLQETNKQTVEVAQEKVFQEQDQVLQQFDEGADEQESIIHNGLCEPQYLEIENGTFEQGNSLINIFVQEMEEGGVPANPAEQNQSEIGKDNVGEKVYMSTHVDDTGNENQSVELANDEDQIEMHGTTNRKLKRKKRLKSPRRNSKRGKKHEINEDTQLQTLSEATLKQHNNIIEGDSDEQNQIIEVNVTDIQIEYENAVGKSVDAGAQNQLERMKSDVAEDVEKDDETTQESHPDNSGYISFGQIQMKQNPQLLQLEKSPDSNPILLKSKHPGKQGLARSQIKTISKKDASVISELMESPGYYVPNDEHLSEKSQQVIETKQVSSAVSTQMNGQRAKLRSSQKNTGHLETVLALAAPLLQMESQQRSRSPSLEKPLKELLKLRPQFPDLDEPATEVQEPGSSQQDQQPDELEDKPKYKGRGRRPKYNGGGRHSPAISKKGQQSAEKCKDRSRHPEPKRDEDTSTDFIQIVKHSHVKKGQQKYQGQQPNEEDEAKYNGHGRHKMMRRSSRKEKDPNS